jgi:carboxyl-terminal processing protease
MKNFFCKLAPVVATILCVSCRKEEEKPAESPDCTVAVSHFIVDTIEEICSNYVDEVAREKLEIGAINGMLSFLDDHSTYIDQEEADAFDKSARGEFLGIGVELKQVRSGAEIEAVVDGSPAFAAGLMAMDVITSIDGKNTAEMSMKDIIDGLSSSLAMQVNITAARGKAKTFDVTLRKSIIQLPSVKVDFLSDIALLRITHFNTATANCAKKVIEEIVQKKATGVILDLRNNPGGVLDQAIKVSSLFLVNKKIVEFRSKRAKDERSVYADDIDSLDGMPMVILMDSNTASGAELVAAALGDNKRAVLIGEKTYGKGSLQTIIPIPGHGALKLTTEYFLSPNGRQINQNGVMPDIEISKEIATEVVAPSQSELPKIGADSKSFECEPIVQRAMDVLHGISALNDASLPANTTSSLVPESAPSPASPN